MKQKTKTILLLVILAVATLLLCTIRYVYVLEPIVKTAVSKGEITEKSFILCKRVRVTGFDWMIVSDSSGSNSGVYCNIEGANPFEELGLKHEFVMADNTYIFYVQERRENYSKELGEMVVEYVVSGWDILYPVQHEAIIGLLKSPKYILESDLDQ